MVPRGVNRDRQPGALHHRLCSFLKYDVTSANTEVDVTHSRVNRTRYEEQMSIAIDDVVVQCMRRDGTTGVQQRCGETKLCVRDGGLKMIVMAMGGV